MNPETENKGKRAAFFLDTYKTAKQAEAISTLAETLKQEGNPFAGLVLEASETLNKLAHCFKRSKDVTLKYW